LPYELLLETFNLSEQTLGIIKEKETNVPVTFLKRKSALPEISDKPYISRKEKK
jgi:hypothetical protein